MSLKAKILCQKVAAPFFIAAAKVVPNIFFPIIKRPKPSGPYFVGVKTVEFLRDNDCESNSEPSNKLSSKIWYPAENVDGLSRQTVFNSDELKNLLPVLSETTAMPSVIIKQLANSVTWSYEKATLIPCSENSLPVVVFSHGFGMLNTSNIQLCEHLASHGYMVISVAHTSFSTAVRFNNNDVIGLDKKKSEPFQKGEIIDAVLSVINTKSLAEREKSTRVWSNVKAQRDIESIWVNNIKACIDSFQNNTCLTDTSEFSQAGNFFDIGAVGMSFGGSASASFGHEDSRIKAVVNLDGGQVGTTLMNKRIDTALLMLHSNAIELSSGGGFNDFHYEEYQTSGLNNSVLRALIDGSSHHDFTDWCLIKGSLARAAFILGKVNGGRMTSMVNELTYTFLNKHLTNHCVNVEATDLHDITSTWKEVKWLDGSNVRNMNDDHNVSMNSEKGEPI